MIDTLEAKKKDQYFDCHSSAAGLILRAARESGLLEHVAELMLASDKLYGSGYGCLSCRLLEQLIDAFDDHVTLPGSVWEEALGDGSDMPLHPKEELAPYLSKPALSEIPA